MVRSHTDASPSPSLPPRYSYANAPVQKELAAQEVGNVAAFLVSPLASAVTGHVMYVDNGLNAMGLAMDSEALKRTD
jgi:enoyl-[acyl-carrier protein] reductase I